MADSAQPRERGRIAALLANRRIHSQLRPPVATTVPLFDPNLFVVPVLPPAPTSLGIAKKKLIAKKAREGYIAPTERQIQQRYEAIRKIEERLFPGQPSSFSQRMTAAQVLDGELSMLPPVPPRPVKIPPRRPLPVGNIRPDIAARLDIRSVGSNNYLLSAEPRTTYGYMGVHDMSRADLAALAAADISDMPALIPIVPRTRGG